MLTLKPYSSQILHPCFVLLRKYKDHFRQSTHYSFEDLVFIWILPKFKLYSPFLWNAWCPMPPWELYGKITQKYNRINVVTFSTIYPKPHLKFVCVIVFREWQPCMKFPYMRGLIKFLLQFFSSLSIKLLKAKQV